MNIPAYELSTSSPELVNSISHVVQQGLISAFRLHEELAERGLEPVHENQFGDTALRADVEAEEAVLQELNLLNIRVFSEEHGIVDYNHDANSPGLTAVLDGMDGSGLYKKERGRGHYGTMLAIFEGSNPTYNDFLAAGIMQHSTGKLIFAARGQGLKVIDVKTGKIEPAHTNHNDYMQPNGAIIYVDDPANPGKYKSLGGYFSMNRAAFSRPLKEAGFTTSWLGASAAYYAAVATGEADAVGESTRKGNLEIATAYGLITEGGGVMVTLDGEDIGAKQLLVFGQNEHIPVLTASNSETASKLLSMLNRPL